MLKREIIELREKVEDLDGEKLVNILRDKIEFIVEYNFESLRSQIRHFLI